jgi:hypothetical protein
VAEYITPDVPAARMSSNTDVYVEEQQPIERYVNGMRIANGKDRAEFISQSQSDVIINITNEENPSNIKSSFAKKTVDVSLNGGNIVAQIQKITT